MKKTALFSALALTASLFGDDELVAAGQRMNGLSKQDRKKEEMRKKEQEQKMMNMVTLTSARPESDNGWYLFADALYWFVDVGSTDWANVNSTNSPTTLSKNKSVDFKWNWGFKAGIGINIDHDMWDSNVYYTWLNANHSSRINKNDAAGTSSVQVLDQIGLGNANSVSLTAGSTKWDFHFSMFDWELGRWYYVSKNIALRPHVGAKGGWIHQKINTQFSNPTLNSPSSIFVSEKFKNNFWGVGPSFGINTMWVLGCTGQVMDHRFSIFGDFGGALMYGHFNVTNKQSSVSSTGAVVHGFNDKGLNRNLAATMLQGIMGLSWDTAFNRGRNHFMLKAGYELQYWFRQNQLVATAPLPSSTSFSSRRLSDDLALQGVTVEFRFDF